MSKLVKVSGVLRAKDGSGNTLVPYKEEFILDESIDTIDKARSLIKKGMINDRLTKTYEGFKNARTMQVDSITDTNDKADESDLTRAMLKAIELNCVPQTIDNYKRPDHKLNALLKAIEAQEERNAKKGE